MPLTNAGRNYITKKIIGDTSDPAFTNANAYLGVGDSTTAFDATHTDLQGTNKTRKGMSTGYPQYQAPNQLIFRALFDTSEANYAWNEIGIFNASSGGTMLSRKVQSLGTKNSSQQWELTITVTVNNA